MNGVTYATSPMGGDHTAGNGLFLQTDHRDPAGKVELSRNLQITSAWVDTLGLCTFVRGVHAADPEVFPALVNGRFGTGTTQTLQELGKKVLAFELEFPGGQVCGKWSPCQASCAASRCLRMAPCGTLRTRKLKIYGKT